MSNKTRELSDLELDVVSGGRDDARDNKANATAGLQRSLDWLHSYTASQDQTRSAALRA
jgi:hypothetical protein